MLIALAVVALVIIAVVGIAATRSDTFAMQRSLAIQASPERLFDLIDDFHVWSSWSPYEKLDPAMKKKWSGAERGKGAVYEWAGNSKAGEGRMEIVESARPSRVAIKLDFLKPFEAHNQSEFTLEAQSGSTNVTWAMHGPRNLMLKIMSLFMDMDKMIGKDFEEGLRNMKALAEAPATAAR